jgi:hypothetical protein
MSDRLKKTRRIGKHPNALKHGVFTSVAILPGEDTREFAALLFSLIEEWEPMGPTENDAVVTIANGMWRKARLQNFLRAKILECKFDASHPAYDEPRTLRASSGALEFAPDCLDELLSSHLLSEERKEHFERKFPPEDFETILARARAIKNEINSEILPSLERCDKSVEGSFLEATKIMGQDDLKNEIALEERIDAMINGAVKRLVQIKAMKQMLRTSSSSN